MASERVIQIYRENTPPTPTLPRAGGGKSSTSQSVEPEEDFHLRGRQNISVMSVYRENRFSVIPQYRSYILNPSVCYIYGFRIKPGMTGHVISLAGWPNAFRA